MIYYAIYNAKDECCFVGSRDECIKWLGFSIDYFYCNVSRTRNGIFQGKQGYRVFKIEEDENEEI